MPGIPNNQQQLVMPDDQVVEQPRQPQNLQGLLRYAMEAGASADSSSSSANVALDNERRSFLQNALSSMTVDVTALMREQIRILGNAEGDLSEADIQLNLNAFDTVMEYVDNIDFANDFHKLDGFSVFEACLKCPHHDIRGKCCELIAELAQNNPYIQSVICESTALIPRLIALMQNDLDENVRIKALYALSCIVRENRVAYDIFKSHDGLAILKMNLSHTNDKLRLKTAFLLSSIHRIDSQLFKEMIDKGFLSVIIDSIKEERRPSHEHLLDLLANMMEHESMARRELAKSNYNVRDIIGKHLDSVKGLEECREEQEYCEKILRFVFAPVA